MYSVHDEFDSTLGSAAFFQKKFTRTTRVRRFLAVHDEIRASRGKNGHPFLVQGVLFIPHERVDKVCSTLQGMRGKHQDLWIEHREIRKTRGPRFEIASRWLDWFKSEGLQDCSFKVFGVNQDGFKRFPYPGDEGYAFHIWKNTVTSFIAGIQWSLPQPKGILLDVVCDSSENRDFLAALELLPRSLSQDMILRRKRQRALFDKRPAGSRRTLRLAPLVRVRGLPKMVSSRPHPSDPENGIRNLVQLTDLLLGVLWDAVEARQVSADTRDGRLKLSEESRELLDPDVVLPWNERITPSRAVSVSLYPDENGRAYPATVMKTKPGQLEMLLPEVRWASRAERKRRRFGICIQRPDDDDGC